MRGVRVQEIPVARLHAWLDEGRFAIPKLQREFVWSGPKAASLLDSIYRGMPIGTLMVWSTTRRNQNVLRQSLHILPEYNPANGRILYVIDGQQRLSVIHQERKGESRANSDGYEVDFSRLSLVLRPPQILRSSSDERAFVYRRPVHGQHASVPHLLASNWKTWFRDLPATKRAWLKDARQTLLKYKIPVTFIETDDLSEIQEVFVRINALGTRISAADGIFASASSLDLRRMATELRDSLPLGFRTVQAETILLAFALITRPDRTDVGARAYQAVVREWDQLVSEDEEQRRRFLKEWGRLRLSMGKAADYLQTRFCVQNESFLPSANMLAILAVFFRYHQRQPSPKQSAEITKWFWATGVGGRYTGSGFRRHIVPDALLFRRLALSGRGRFQMDDQVDPADIRRTLYNTSASITSAFLCLLAGREPRYLENGDRIPLSLFASSANRSNLHHIFPRALMANMGIRKTAYNSICNICLLVAEENQSFGSRKPASYLEPFVGRRHFRRTMKSHLIPAHEPGPLWTRGVNRAFPVFLRDRQRLLCNAFEEVAGIKLFRRKEA
jgi:hypothetical protein